MKILKLLLVLVLLTSGCAYAQDNHVYTKEIPAKEMKKAQKWVKKGKWRNGFKGNPHATVNAAEFMDQYNKNPQQWDAAFNWLATTDLLGIEKGRYQIEGTNLFVNVEDDQNGPLETRGSESHRKAIDLQYCVKGIERFGLLDHNTSTPNGEYRPDVQHYNFDWDHTLLVDSDPNEFFLFFPDDWHIAKIQNDTDDQNIRVLVIKIDYIE